MCKDAPSPDAALGEAAKANAETAKEALDFYKTVYENDLKPMQQKDQALREGLIEDTRASMRQQQKFADDQKKYYDEVYQPIERKSAQEAMEYDSEANIGRRRGIAASTVNSQFSNAANQNRRALAAYGINPNSGAFARANNSLTTQQAMASAAAQNQAGFEMEDRGIALRAGVANFGRNMPNTAAQFYSGSGAAGSNAANISSQGMAGVNQNAATGGAGFNTAIQGNSSAANIYLGQYNAQMQGHMAKQQMIGDLAGAAGMAYGMKSSKDYKKDKTKIRDGKALESVERLDVESWKYKPGIADEGRHIGPYAEDFKREFGVGNGKEINLQDAVGVTMKAVQDLAKEVRGLQGKKMANGGRVHKGRGAVRGPGGPVDDKVPAMLSDGEYVLPADTVKRIGKKKLDAIVKKTHTPAAEQRRGLKRSA